MRKGSHTAGCQLGSVAVGTRQRMGAGRTVPTSQPLLLLQVMGGILPPSLAKKAALQTTGSTQPLTEERDAGAGTGVLVQAGEPVALGKREQHQPRLVDPPLRVFLH